MEKARGRAPAAIPSDSEPGSDRATFLQGVAVRQTGVPEDVDAGDARVQRALQPPLDLFLAAFRPDVYRRPGASESADCPRFGPAKGDRDSFGLGRPTRQAHPPTPGGDSGPGPGGRVSN